MNVMDGCWMDLLELGSGWDVLLLWVWVWLFGFVSEFLFCSMCIVCEDVVVIMIMIMSE